MGVLSAAGLQSNKIYDVCNLIVCCNEWQRQNINLFFFGMTTETCGVENAQKDRDTLCKDIWKIKLQTLQYSCPSFIVTDQL